MLSGPAREEAIERFRARLGALSGPVVFAFPGWHARWEYQPNCGQVAVVYTDTNGKEWKLLKDLECSFGNAFHKGGKEEEEKIVQMVEEATTKADPVRFGVGARTARETQSTFSMTMDGNEKVLEAHEVMQMRRSKKAKRPRVELQHLSGDPLRSLDPIGLAQEGWAESLATDEEAQLALSECSKLMVEKWGTAALPELIAVYGVPGARKYRRRMVGVYRKLPEPLGGRACFQRLLHSPTLCCTLGCDRIYILWSESREQWQFAVELADSESAARLAFAEEDVVSPVKVAGSWQVQDGFDEFTLEPALMITRPGP